MKKFIFFITLFLSQFVNASWITSFEEAQKLSLATNKFIVVDFWATWCGPCKKMDYDSWSDQEVGVILQDYIQLKIDIDTNRELANKYDIKSIPNMFIMDGNGKVVYSFLGYRNASELKKEIEKFAISTEFMSLDLINYFKKNSFNTSARVAQKYLDYSLYVDEEIKSNILKVSDKYLSDAKKDLSKKEDDYKDKYQKLELLELFRFAYSLNFTKLEKKLLQFKEFDILESNLNYYYFLKYMVAKGLNKEDFAEIDSKYKLIEGFDYFIKKSELILSKKV
ncbi:thioredoxin family protein [Flavobacterium sp.]|uniref:thioredoxin family protein n=1 Tax=Flavobacterium sp. TaxID=239 RepID=UPI0037510B10